MHIWYDKREQYLSPLFYFFLVGFTFTSGRIVPSISPCSCSADTNIHFPIFEIILMEKQHLSQPLGNWRVKICVEWKILYFC